MAKLINGEQFKSESGIATNSLVSTSGDFVAKSAAGFVTLNTVGVPLLGITHTVKTFAADNQTVTADRVIYASKNTGDIMRVVIAADAAITQANEDDLFDINADGTVDVATSGTGDQVQMTKFVSQTSSVYKIV
tara:strand:- start:12039 stop:12440 length:402 start_codon:yes stop_codon:yes gene_type:complete